MDKINFRAELAGKKKELLALAGMTGVYFFSYFQRIAIPGTIFNEIQTDLNLTAVAVTGLGAIYLYVYAGMQVFVGITSDASGGMKTLLFGSLFLVAGSVMFPLSSSVEMLYVSRVLTGFGGSFMYISAVREIETLFGPRLFPALMGPMLFMGYAGGIVATSPFERSVASFGWRYSLIAVAIFTAIIVIAGYFAFLPFMKRQKTEKTVSYKMLLEVIANRKSYSLLIVNMMNFPVYFVVQAILGKKFLQDFTGISSAGAGFFMLLMILTSGVIVFCSGPILNLTNQRRKPILLASACLLLAGTVVLLLGVKSGSPAWVFLTGYIMLAMAMGAGPAAATTMKELNNPGVAGFSVSFINTVCYAGVAVLANVAGVVLDSFADKAVRTSAGVLYPQEAYFALFCILVGVACAVLIFTLFVPETKQFENRIGRTS